MFTMGPCVPKATTQVVPVLTLYLPLGKQKVGLILCPFRNIKGGRELVLPLEHWRPQVELEVLVAQHT